MSDPIQISMYIQSLGLSGAEAESKRAELEKLSDAELTALITGKPSQTFAPYDFSKAVFEFTPTSSTTGISVEKQSAPQAQEKKKYSAYEKTQLRNFASQYLLDSASNAYSAIDDYNKSVGLISTDAVVNGFKIFTGQEDRHALQERLGEELKQAEDLNSTLSRPGAFESKFERTRGVLYNPENIDNLKQKSEEYLEISAYQEKYNILSQGIKDIKKIIREEQEYNQTRKYVSGPAVASLTPPETSSHEKFGEVLLQLCNGDKELVNQYMQQITSKMGSRAEIEKNMPQILEELQTNFKAEYDKKLAGKSFEQYTKEYESAYSKALGGKNPEFATQNFIEKAKTQSAYTEMGLIIASSLLLPGSSTVAKGTAALARNVGTKAAGQIVKGAMTATMGAAPAGLTALNAATSEKGFTAETKNEIFEELKSGLMYGGFGAYVSGPLGNAVENLLKTKPEVLGSVVSRVMSNGKTGETVAKVTGVMAETSADVMFDGLTSDMSVLESLQTNGGMNFAMMIAGGRIAKMHQNLQGIKIEQQNNGTYKIKDATGKLILNAKDENALATFILGKGLETETVADKKNVLDNEQINHINKPDEGIVMPEKPVEEEVIDENRKLQLANIERYKKTAKPEDMTLTINGEEKVLTAFKGQMSVDGSMLLTDNNKMYKLSGVKKETECKNELFAGDMYELIGAHKRQRELVQTDKGTAVLGESITLAGGFIGDKSAVAKTYGMDALLGLRNNIVLKARNDNGSTPVVNITAPFNVWGTEPVELVRLFEPTSKNSQLLKTVSKQDIIDSLQKIADMPDEKISELADARNIDDKDRMVNTLLARKEFIAKFLDNMKQTEQEGLPINEYVKNVYDKTSAEIKYASIKEQNSTGLTDYLHETHNVSTKDMLNYQSLLKDTQIADYLKTELEQGNISLDELNEITAALYGNVKMGRYLQASPEIKMQYLNTLIDLKRNNNISMVSGSALINNHAQDAETKEIKTEVINLIKQVSEQFDNNPDITPAIYRIIKDGKINETALKLSTDLYKNGVEINTITGILNSATRNGMRYLDTAKAEVINELIKSGKSQQDIGTYIKAMDTPSGLDASMTEYVDKFKAMGLDNRTIDGLFSNIRVHTQQGPVQRTYVLDWISKLAGEHPDSKTVISAARQLVRYNESFGPYIDKIAANNKEVNLGNLTKILKSLTDSNTPFDQNGFQFAVNMLTRGVSPENLDNIITSSRWASNDPERKDIMAARTAKLRELAGTLLTEKGKSTAEVFALVRNLSDDFSINLVKDNIDNLSQKELYAVLTFTNMQPSVQKELYAVLTFTNMPPSVQKDREKLADFMLDLLKNKGYSLDDVTGIANKIITTQTVLNRVSVTGIEEGTLDFAQKCAAAGYSGKDIIKLAYASRIWNNAMEFTPEQKTAEIKKITDFAENLLFEKGFPPKNVAELMNAAAFKTNRTPTQAALTYGFDDKAIKFINDLVEDKSITPESDSNISELIKVIKLLDYDTQAIDTAKDLLKNEVTLENGKSYKIDSYSIAAFLMEGRNSKTEKFEPERFNKAIQNYILIKDYGFTFKEIDNITGLSQNDVTVESLHMSTGAKVNLLNKLSYAPKDAIDCIQSQILSPDNPALDKIDLTSVEQITQKLLSGINISSRHIQTTNVQRQQFLNNFISNRGRDSETGLNHIETKLSEYDFTQYGKEGLPLKYSRSDFIANLNDILEDLTPEQRADVLQYHNIDLDNNVFNSTPRTHRLEPIDVNLSDSQAASLFKELDSLLDGVNENNRQLFKENNIDTIIEKCRQLASIDETRFESIAGSAENLDIDKLKAIKDKAVKFGETAYNTDAHNIPAPLGVKTINAEAASYENFTPEMQAASQKIETEYNKFIYENEFVTDDKELNEILNGIMKGLPDVMLTIGKPQHKTHKYSLDVHTMTVLQKALTDEDYKNLSDKDKTILKYAILLHDFGKKYVNPDTPDTGHEIDSAEIARGILAQFKLPQQVKDRIIGIIKNHDWFARFNKGQWDSNKVSALFRSPDDYKIARIMAKSDLSSINDDFHYRVMGMTQNQTPDGFKAAFDRKLANLDTNYSKLYQATNLVYNTKILNKDKIPYNEKYGVRMLNLADESLPADKDLGEYGLNGSTKDNMRFSVHMVAEDNLYGNMESAKLGMEQTVNDNNVWSISLVKMDRTRTYMNRKYGFLTDVPASNIAIAYPNNLGSGYEKTTDKFVELLYSDTAQKNFLRTKFLQSMEQNGVQFSKEDYQVLTQMIYNKQFLSQLETQPYINVNGRDIPSGVISNAVFESMNSLLTGQTHSEMVAINPKIQGLIARTNNPDSLPADFINFAKKYNLPILLIGDK